MFCIVSHSHSHFFSSFFHFYYLPARVNPRPSRQFGVFWDGRVLLHVSLMSTPYIRYQSGGRVRSFQFWKDHQELTIWLHNVKKIPKIPIQMILSTQSSL